jgi:outer membrane protein TolC
LTIDVSSGLNQSDNLEKDNVYEADLTGNVSINASYTLSSTMFEQSYMETITLSIKKIEAEKTKYDVISNTKLAFLNVLVTQEILKFENFSFEKAKNYLEKASQKYELGWGTEEDKIRAEINLSNKEISYERAKSNLLKNKNRLFSSIGFDLITDENDNNVKIIGNLEYKPYITDVNSAVEQALSENLDLKALILSRQLLNANIDLLHLNKITKPHYKCWFYNQLD